MIKPEKVYEVFGITDYLYKLLTGSNNPVIKSSPEMLIALVNILIHFDIMGWGYTNDGYDATKKAIESADSKNRPWSELLMELTK